jgi:hypothetical protein
VRDVLRLPDASHRDHRRRGVLEVLHADADPGRPVAAVISVSMKPGAIALQVTPNLPSSIGDGLREALDAGLGRRVVRLAAVAERRDAGRG